MCAKTIVVGNKYLVHQLGPPAFNLFCGLYGAEGDLSETLPVERPVTYTSQNFTATQYDQGLMLPIEHEAQDILRRHLGELLRENSLQVN